MTPNEFVTQDYEELKKASIRISQGSELWEELLHYTIDEFLRKPAAQSIVDSGAARFFCVRIMLNSWNSVTSVFFNTYRDKSKQWPMNEDMPDRTEDESKIPELALRAQQLLLTLPWYDRMLFETYVNESHTVSSLARVTGIPRTSVSLTINRVRKYLKKNL